MSKIKITIELEDGLAGCEIKANGDEVKDFNELDRKQQIHVCNALARFYELFFPCVRNDLQNQTKVENNEVINQMKGGQDDNNH